MVIALHEVIRKKENEQTKRQEEGGRQRGRRDLRDKTRGTIQYSKADRFEWFIEAHAYLRLYDSVLRLPPLPLSRQKFGLATHMKTEKETICWRKRGEGAGVEPNHTT
jgi:hypothetical protein